MRLVILGSGTAIPHASRGSSGYACVSSTGAVLLIECGPGSTRRWPRFGITFDTVCGVVVTHHHVDHCGELAAFLFGRNVVEPKPTQRVLVAGPVGHRVFVENLERTYGPPVADREGRIAISELEDGSRVEWSDFSIETRVMRHVPGALGVRIRADEKTVAFSGDSGPCDSLVELCLGVDVALLECSYPKGRQSESHLNAETAAQTAIDAGVTRLWLTHFYPECDAYDIEAEVRAVGYRHSLHLAADGDVLDL